MTFGMDSSGFTKKKLSDIKTSLEESIQSVFGVANVDPESTFGQIVGIWAEASAELWDLAEDVYYSQYPISAEGVALDNAVDLTGISRLSSGTGFATVILEGDEGTVVPALSQFKQSSTNELFESEAPVTITKIDVLQIVLTVNNLQDSDPYSATIDGTLNEIPASAYPNELSVLTALKTEIDTNMLDYTTVLDSDAVTLTVLITDKRTPFTSDKSTDLDMEIWTPTIVNAVTAGDISIPANSIDTIETPVSGLNQVDNLLSGEPGRAVETDDELRIRRKQSLRVAGAATVPAIESRILQEVDEVVSSTVVENRTDVTDIDGRPPHSFEAIVSGGADQAIGNKIWEVKPAGIQTYADLTEGGVEVDVIDSQGQTQKIYFSRPVSKYVHLNVEITLYDEEQFPTDGITAIKNAIKAFGDLFEPGDNLITQRFYTPIYTVPGILDIPTLEFAVTAAPGDPTTPITGTTSAVALNKLIDTVGTPFTDSVSGMIVKNTTDSLITSVNRKDSNTQLDIVSDIFDDVGDAYSVGGFGQVNVPLAAKELALFDVARIAVAIV